MKLSELLVLVGCFACGCSHPAIHVLNPPQGPPPSGWSLEDDREDGVQVAVPAGWRVGADSSIPDLASLSGSGSQMTGGDGNAAMAGLMKQTQDDLTAMEATALAKLREKGIVVQVIDSSRPIPGEERTRFYVLVTKHDGNWTLEQARDAEVEFYRGWGADPPKKVHLPVGDSYQFTSLRKTRGGDDQCRLSYVVVDGHKTYTLRFVATNNSQAVTSIAAPVADSWRIKPGKEG